MKANPYRSESQDVDDYDAWWDGYARGLRDGVWSRYLTAGLWVLNILLLVYLIVTRLPA
jgi:hypothetical protein